MVQEEPFKFGLKDSQVWVGSPAVTLSGTNLMGKRGMVFTNNAGVTAYLGSGNVVQGSGTPLGVGKQISIPIGGSIFLSGIGSGTGSADIRILEFG